MSNQNPKLQWDPNDVPVNNPHAERNDGQVQNRPVPPSPKRNAENGFSNSKGRTPMDIVNKLRKNPPKRNFIE